MNGGRRCDVQEQTASPPSAYRLRNIPASRLFISAEYVDTTGEGLDAEEKRVRLFPTTEHLGDLDRLAIQLKTPRRFVSPVARMALYADTSHVFIDAASRTSDARRKALAVTAFLYSILPAGA